MRSGAVKYLQSLGWDVTVVMPAYRSLKIKHSENIIQIPTLSLLRVTHQLQRIGLMEDYLDIWVQNAYYHLKSIIKNEDIIFATSGGDLGTLKLAVLLKNKIGCKIVFNFRDPLEYALCNGLKMDDKYHVSREKVEKKYIYQADLIVTSSNSYRDNILLKYNDLSTKIYTNYFGYVEPVKVQEQKVKYNNVLNICYMGTMTKAQKPEILIEAYNMLQDEYKKKIRLVFIGDYMNYTPFHNYLNNENIKFMPYMKHDELLRYMTNHIDVGFVSLTDDYYGACVPSKIYEYINLGLPMIGALPYGDGIDIINNNGYGKSVYYKEINKLSEIITLFTDKNFMENCKNSVINDKEMWSMKNQINKLNELLLDLKNAK